MSGGKNISEYIFENIDSKNIKINDSINISVVNDTNKFYDFYKVAEIVYKDNPYWVAPFFSEIKKFFKKKNLFWSHSKCSLFVAYKKNKPIGRIGAFIDEKFCNKEGEKIGFFGFFECINDKKVGLSLLKVAQDWLKSKNINKMQGPINGRADIGSGFLTQGFEYIPFLIGHYSHKYYTDFAEEFKMKKSKDLVSYLIDLKKPIPMGLKEKAEECESKGVKIRTFNKLKFKKEMKWFLEMFMIVFTDHWGYTPVSIDEVKNRFGIKELRWIVDPKLFLVAEVNGKPIGFRLTLPDYNILLKDLNGKLGVKGLLYFFLNKKMIKRGRFIVMGIDKEYRGLGIGTCMNYYNLLEMKKRGYETAEYGWIDENNIASRKAGERLGGKLYKIYRVYEKTI